MTSLEFFRIIASQFSSISDEVVNQWLLIAGLNANTACLDDDRKNLALAYYAAHLLFLDAENSSGSGGRGPIKSEREGDLSRTYGDGYGGNTWYSLSPYGQEYWNMISGCIGGGIMTRFGSTPIVNAAPYADDVNVWGQPRNLY